MSTTRKLLYISVAARLATFSANQLLLKFVTPDELAYNGQLELLLNATCFFSSEAVRLAVQRMPRSTSPQAVTNLSWIAISLAVPMSFLVSRLGHMTYHVTTLSLVALQAAAEPLVNLAVHRGEFVRAQYEAVALTAGCLWNFAGVVAGLDPRIVFFTGRLIYGVTVLAQYLKKWMVTKESLGFKQYDTSPGRWFDSSSVAYLNSVFVQMVFKNLLTEGDKFMFTRVCSPVQQGIYAVISNYGGLVARLVFSPVEEAVKLSLAGGNRSDGKANKNVSKLAPILKFYTYFGTAALLFGTFNAPVLGSLFFGQILRLPWYSEHVTEVSSTLTAYAAYLPILATNGVFEAYFQSAASARLVSVYSGYLVLCSVVFVAICYSAIPSLGLAALVGANIVSMLMRIVFCGVSLRAELGSIGVEAIVPDWKAYVGGSMALLAVQISRGVSRGVFDLAVSVGMGILWVLGVAVMEKFPQTFLEKLKSRKMQQMKHEKHEKHEKHGETPEHHVD